MKHISRSRSHETQGRSLKLSTDSHLNCVRRECSTGNSVYYMIARSWGAIVVVSLFLFDQMKSLVSNTVSPPCRSLSSRSQEFQSDCLHSVEWLFFRLDDTDSWSGPILIDHFHHDDRDYHEAALHAMSAGGTEKRMEQERHVWLHASFDLIIHLSVAGFVSGIHLCDLICFLSHHHHVLSFSFSLFLFSLSLSCNQSERSEERIEKHIIIKREKKKSLRSSTEWKWRNRNVLSPFLSLFFFHLEHNLMRLHLICKTLIASAFCMREGEFLLCCSLILISSTTSDLLSL